MIWHSITRDDLLEYSPGFPDRLAKISSTDSYANIVHSQVAMVSRTPQGHAWLHHARPTFSIFRGVFDGPCIGDYVHIGSDYFQIIRNLSELSCQRQADAFGRHVRGRKFRRRRSGFNGLQQIERSQKRLTMFKSRMWSIGWNPQVASLKGKKRHISPRQSSRSFAARILSTGLSSVPGRTARLKAIYLLQIAAEIDHALTVQYLYAAYAVDEHFAEGRDDGLLATITRWKRDTRTVARQEMAHLITVQNLLIALGAEVYLNRENNFLDHPNEYPFPVSFEPLSVETVAKYVATESPEPTEVFPQRDRKLLNDALRLVRADLKTKINRVGAVYLTLFWLFLRNDGSTVSWKHSPSIVDSMKRAGLLGVHIRDQDFVGLRELSEFDATPEEWGVFEPAMKVSRSDPRSRALAAIHWIMAQGEGPVGMRFFKAKPDDRSHFKKFLSIFEEFRSPNSDFRGAVRDVPVNPVASDQRHAGTPRGIRNFTTEPRAKMWAQLFNLRYQMLLIDILLALSTSRRKDGELRRKLIQWAVNSEMDFLRVIGQFLPTLPRHAGSKARAGAPFETIDVPVDAAKRWDLQGVLMKGSDHLVKELGKTVGRGRDERNVLLQIEKFDAGRLSLVVNKSRVRRNFAWQAGRVSRNARTEGL